MYASSVTVVLAPVEVAEVEFDVSASKAGSS